MQSNSLHQELVDFYDYIQPTEAEMVMRGQVVGRIIDVVQGIWSKAEVKVFGSFATSLLLPTRYAM
jgi:non-canonical poly(A) RNA polymerase PAPD5/7